MRRLRRLRPPGKEEVRDACSARKRTDDTARRCAAAGRWRGPESKATPRFSVVDRGATAGHGRRRPAKISLQIASIASIATCGPFRVTPRLCGLVDARWTSGGSPPGSARMPTSAVSGDLSAGESPDAVRPARLPPQPDAPRYRPGMRSGLSRRRSRARVPSLALSRSHHF
jgi:hypothetical protein